MAIQNSLVASPKGNTLYDVITSKSTADKLRAQMATHVSPERLARVAWGALMKTPKLLKATQESILYCIAECARLGLEPSLGRVYFLPFDNNKKGVTECQLIIGYQGFLDLARRSGIVSSINGRCVYENEKFEYKISLDTPVLNHEPCLTGEKGPLVGAYCIARFKDGNHVEYMSKSEIEEIRKRSKAANSGPWVTDYDAMALKTVIRRSAKFWPLTTASPELQDAIQMSDDTEYIDVESEPVKPPTAALETPQGAMAPANDPFAPESVEESAFDSLSHLIGNAKSKGRLATLGNEIVAERQKGTLTEEEAVELNQKIKDRTEEL